VSAGGHGAASRIRLDHVGIERARAIVAGDLSVVDAGEGWPHADTLGPLRMDAEHAASDEETVLLVLLVDGGQVIGDGGWKGGPDADGGLEIGYGLAAPWRGRGLGTELVALLSARALARPGVTHLHAEVLADNLPSRRALERNGFTVVGDEPPYVRYALRPHLGGRIASGVTGE
jgi:ribosomal-protein-alanine N-acetyltransferase